MVFQPFVWIRDCARKTLRRVGLRGRLGLVVAVFMLPSFLLLLWNANEHRTAVMAAARDKASSLAEIGAAHESDSIQEVQDVFRVLSRVPQITSAGDPSCAAVLAGVVSDHPQILFLATTDAQGRIVCSSLAGLVGVTISGWTSFAPTMAPGGTPFSLSRIGNLPHLPDPDGLAALAPLPRGTDGAPAGVFVAELDLKWLNTLARQVATDPEDRVAILDPDTSSVLAAFPPLPKAESGSAARYPAFAAYRQSHKDGVVEGDGPDSKACIFGYASMQPEVRGAPHTPAILTVGLARDEVVRGQTRQMAISVVLAVLALGIAIVLIGWLAELRVLRPMRHVTRAASRLSEGSLDARVDMRHIPMQEMRVLGTTFNMMATALQQLAHIDSLTGVANRRQFDRAVEAEVHRANRAGTPLSLLMIDADHFKSFNDQFGHLAGDACLRRLAETLRAGARRATDLVARYGGEEFAMLLPDTNEEGARDLAEALLQAVRDLAIDHPHADAGIVTISIGVATLTSPPAIEAAVLIEQADQALYTAKQSGRNTAAFG